MNPWQRLLEGPWFVGAPDDTGMRQLSRQDQESEDYPYDTPGSAESPMDPTGQFAASHHALTPKNTEHSIWDDAVAEAAGLGMSIAKSSPGGMTGVVPGGAKFGGDPFDHKVPDDELEKAGHKGRYRRGDEQVGDPVDTCDTLGDKELKAFMASMKSQQDPLDSPASPLPSDLVVFSGDGFTQGLSQARKNHRDLFGIADGVDGEMPDETVWAYLESYLEQLMVQKTRK